MEIEIKQQIRSLKLILDGVKERPDLAVELASLSKTLCDTLIAVGRVSEASNRPREPGETSLPPRPPITEEASKGADKKTRQELLVLLKLERKKNAVLDKENNILYSRVRELEKMNF